MPGKLALFGGRSLTGGWLGAIHSPCTFAALAGHSNSQRRQRVEKWLATRLRGNNDVANGRFDGLHQGLHVRPIWNRGRHADWIDRGRSPFPDGEGVARQSQFLRDVVASDAFRELDDRRAPAPGTYLVPRDWPSLCR